MVSKGDGHLASSLGSENPESPTGRQGLESLTPRQLEVLRLVARGLSNAEVAEALFLSRRTIHAHVRTIFRKLAVGNRSLATRYAVQHGLI